MIPTLFFPVFFVNIEFNIPQGPGLSCNNNVLVPIICCNPICNDTTRGSACNATTTATPGVVKNTTTETTTPEAATASTAEATPDVTSSTEKGEVTGVISSTTIETSTSEAASSTTTETTPEVLSSTVGGKVVENDEMCLLPDEYREELIKLHNNERHAVGTKPLTYDCMFEELGTQGLQNATQLGYSAFEVQGKYSDYLLDSMRDDFEKLKNYKENGKYKKMIDPLATKFGCYGTAWDDNFLFTCIYNTKKSEPGVKIPMPSSKGVKTA